MNTVKAVLQQFYAPFREKYSLSAQQAKAYKDILNCRTSALGGHALLCEECGHMVIQYNSCRNRHCPTCQGLKKEIWIDKRSKDILEVPYFHTVFTMPQELHALIYQNQELLYNLMYKAVADTLLELSADTKYLGAQIGFFSLLHTWAQDLHFHPHIHTVILAGGITKKNQWVSSSQEFFIPVKVVAKKFRGKFLYYLKQYYYEQLLVFYGDAQQYQNPRNFQALLNQCYKKNWYTYTKRTFSGPLEVIKYLGRYTHRVAISNHRIVSVDEKNVSFTVKDRKQGIRKIVTLTGIEFVRRFLMHILPKGFVKIRHYGLLANRNKKTKLELGRKLTNSTTYPAKLEGLSSAEILYALTGRDVTQCPVCGKKKITVTYSQFMGASP